MRTAEKLERAFIQEMCNGIYTLDDLKMSESKEEFWIACNDISKEIVRKNYMGTETLRNLRAWDYDDLVSELTIAIVKKFGTQVDAIRNPKPDENGVIHEHNYNAYNTAIFDNLKKDKLKKYIITEKTEETDENNKKHIVSKPVESVDSEGNKKKIFYSVLSMDQPISKESDTYTWGDTIESPNDTEAEAIKNVEEVEALRDNLNILMMICTEHRFKGQAYVFVEDLLLENNERSEKSVKSSLHSMLAVFNKIHLKSKGFKIVAEAAFVRAYNKDLNELASLAAKKGIDGNFVLTRCRASFFQDFGRKFHVDADNFFKLRHRNQTDIAKFKGYEIPKKANKDKETEEEITVKTR